MQQMANKPPEMSNIVELSSSKTNPTKSGIFIPYKDELLDTETDAVPWPDDLDKAALYGLAGDVVKTIVAETEADEAAILTNFLVAFGSVIGRTSHFTIDGTPHYTNLFAMIVGSSFTGRKGTSWGYIRGLFEIIDKTWIRQKVVSGLSSGEGLIWAIRDPIKKFIPDKDTGKEKEIIEDSGIEDKRILLNESEFGKALRAMQRDGNTLSVTLRQAWDSISVIQSLTKGAKGQATEPHISLIGHITKEELNKLLDVTEILNGLGNRFIWVCSRRSKLLPFGGSLPAEKLQNLADEVSRCVVFAQGIQEMVFSSDVKEIWPEVYREMSEPIEGIVGVAVARGIPIVRRLACIYALLDQSSKVEVDHLNAALAVWDRAYQSARFIFGEAKADGDQEKIERGILICLKDGKKTQTEIYNYFMRHKSSKKIRQALEALSAQNKVKKSEEKSENAIRAKSYWELI